MDKNFKSHREITDYLDGLGYRISKSKIGRDLKALGIKRNSEGVYPQKAILEYAATLERKGDDGFAPAEIQAKKAAMELELLELKAAKFKFEMDKEAGKYILRDDFYLEMAARGVVFESGFRHLFATTAREIIALVGGKVERTADLLEFLNQELDKQLNKYATTDTFQVLFDFEDGE